MVAKKYQKSFGERPETWEGIGGGGGVWRGEEPRGRKGETRTQTTGDHTPANSQRERRSELPGCRIMELYCWATLCRTVHKPRTIYASCSGPCIYPLVACSDTLGFIHNQQLRCSNNKNLPLSDIAIYLTNYSARRKITGHVCTAMESSFLRIA